MEVNKAAASEPYRETRPGCDYIKTLYETELFECINLRCILISTRLILQDYFICVHGQTRSSPDAHGLKSKMKRHKPARLFLKTTAPKTIHVRVRVLFPLCRPAHLQFNLRLLYIPPAAVRPMWHADDLALHWWSGLTVQFTLSV